MKFKIFSSLEEANTKLPIGQSIVLFPPNHQSICLSHSQDGFFAVQNVCPHAGASLHEGFINEYNEIVCPFKTCMQS